MWLNDKGYKNAAALWLKYSNEERTHADWARDYLLSLGVLPCTPALKAPAEEYAGLPDIIRQSYEHEIVVSQQVTELANKAMKEGNHMLYTLAAKYLAEQVEEHSKFQDILDKLDTFGESKESLFLLDNSFSD